MADTLEGAGVELAFEQRGQGASVLLSHGIGSDRRIWSDVVAALGDELRTIAYDRRGCGASGAPEPYEGTTIEEQAEDAAAVLERLEAAPAVFCGHSLGAVVGLDLLRRRPEALSGAVLIEPPLFSLSPLGHEQGAAIRQAAEEGMRDGGERGLIEAVGEVICGPGEVERLGRARFAARAPSARVLALELAATPKWAFTRGELEALGERRVILICGRDSGQVWLDVCTELEQLLPRAELREVDSRHVVPLVQPEAVAAAVRELAAEQ